MRIIELFLSASLLVACAATSTTGTTTDPEGPDAAVDDASPWHHLESKAIVALGSPHHRGTDVIATTDAATQTVAGRVTYGPTDKSLEDEDVEVSATIDGASRSLGIVRTDDDGRFALTLAGADRLPQGLHDLSLRVLGDGTTASFVAFVAARGSHVIVSDVDGTLTESETAYPKALVTGNDVAAQPDVATKLAAAAAGGAAIVYVSTRGDRFTEDTRTWLAAHGFPKGALRLPRSLVTIPGEDTVEAKTAMLGDVAPFSIIAGLGNRHTDVEAYASAGIPASSIFVKLPEYEGELADDLAAGRAVGIEDYALMPLAH